MVKLASLILFVFGFCLSQAQFNYYETDKLRLISYDFGHEYILKHAGRCFHNALAFHEQLFDYTPTQKINVLIQDFGDYGNAGATGVPNNSISMGLSPFSYAFETNPAGERVFSMMNHELVHVVALDATSKGDRFWQKVFLGKVEPTNDHPISMIYSYLTNPRRYSPRWYHEGIASYLETWMAGGIGLAQGSYDEMVFRSKVLEDAHIYSAQGLESEGVTTDFQGRTNSYLYGTRFMGYMAYREGPDKLVEWVKRGDGSKASFVNQFKHVYDQNIGDSWNDWIDWENKWQTKNINKISNHPVTEVRRISAKALGSVSYPHYDSRSDNVYIAVNYPGTVPHIAALDLKSGKLSKLTDVKGPALFYVSSVTYDPDSNVIYYTSDNDAWRDLNAYDVSRDKSVVLQKDFRTGDLTFDRTDKSIWGIKHLNGISTIVRVPRDNPALPNAGPYGTWKQMYTLDYGQDIYDIDMSPDGKWLSAAVSDLNGIQSLILYDVDSLKAGKVVIDSLVPDLEVSSAQGFRFTDDGKALYGTSYYSGVSNIYKYELETRDVYPITNVVNGLFRPIKFRDDSLFAFEYTSDGFEPVFLKDERADTVSAIDYLGTLTVSEFPDIIEGWEQSIPSSSEVPIDSMILYEGEYKPSKLTKVNYGYPIVVAYKNRIGLGYKINIADPFKFRELTMSLAYTPNTWNNGITRDLYPDSLVDLEDKELIHFSLEARKGKWNLNLGYNEASFYDLFGPTQSSRKGLRANIGFRHNFIYDPPINLVYNAGLGGYYGLDQSPDFQQIQLSGFDGNFYLNLSNSLTYSNVRGSLGGVDGEKGVTATAWISLVESAGKFYPRAIGMFDFGIPLPGKHFSFWGRTAVGSAFSDKFNPFTRFGFAAFGNNYVDFQSARRYRNPFSFPGVSYTAGRSIIAKNFGKVLGEFVFPPIRFKKFGGYRFFANWIQPMVFGSYLGTRDVGFEGDSYYEQFANAGIQIDLRLVTFSFLPSTISFGYANAWDLDSGRRFNEWMISLQLLR